MKQIQKLFKIIIFLSLVSLIKNKLSSDEQGSYEYINILASDKYEFTFEYFQFNRQNNSYFSSMKTNPLLCNLQKNIRETMIRFQINNDQFQIMLEGEQLQQKGEGIIKIPLVKVLKPNIIIKPYCTNSKIDLFIYNYDDLKDEDSRIINFLKIEKIISKFQVQKYSGFRFQYHTLNLQTKEVQIKENLNKSIICETKKNVSFLQKFQLDFTMIQANGQITNKIIKNLQKESLTILPTFLNTLENITPLCLVNFDNQKLKILIKNQKNSIPFFMHQEYSVYQYILSIQNKSLSLAIYSVDDQNKFDLLDFCEMESKDFENKSKNIEIKYIFINGKNSSYDFSTVSLDNLQSGIQEIAYLSSPYIEEFNKNHFECKIILGGNQKSESTEIYVFYKEKINSIDQYQKVLQDDQQRESSLIAYDDFTNEFKEVIEDYFFQRIQKESKQFQRLIHQQKKKIGLNQMQGEKIISQSQQSETQENLSDEKIEKYSQNESCEEISETKEENFDNIQQLKGIDKINTMQKKNIQQIIFQQKSKMKNFDKKQKTFSEEKNKPALQLFKNEQLKRQISQKTPFAKFNQKESRDLADQIITNEKPQIKLNALKLQKMKKYFKNNSLQKVYKDIDNDEFNDKKVNYIKKIEKQDIQEPQKEIPFDQIETIIKKDEKKFSLKKQPLFLLSPTQKKIYEYLEQHLREKEKILEIENKKLPNFLKKQYEAEQQFSFIKSKQNLNYQVLNELKKEFLDQQKWIMKIENSIVKFIRIQSKQSDESIRFNCNPFQQKYTDTLKNLNIIDLKNLKIQWIQDDKYFQRDLNWNQIFENNIQATWLDAIVNGDSEFLLKFRLANQNQKCIYRIRDQKIEVTFIPDNVIVYYHKIKIYKREIIYQIYNYNTGQVILSCNEHFAIGNQNSPIFDGFQTNFFGKTQKLNFKLLERDLKSMRFLTYSKKMRVMDNKSHFCVVDTANYQLNQKIYMRLFSIPFSKNFQFIEAYFKDYQVNIFSLHYNNQVKYDVLSFNFYGQLRHYELDTLFYIINTFVNSNKITQTQLLSKGFRLGIPFLYLKKDEPARDIVVKQENSDYNHFLFIYFKKKDIKVSPIRTIFYLSSNYQLNYMIINDQTDQKTFKKLKSSNNNQHLDIFEQKNQIMLYKNIINLDNLKQYILPNSAIKLEKGFFLETNFLQDIEPDGQIVIRNATLERDNQKILIVQDYVKNRALIQFQFIYI